MNGPLLGCAFSAYHGQFIIVFPGSLICALLAAWVAIQTRKDAGAASQVTSLLCIASLCTNFKSSEIFACALPPDSTARLSAAFALDSALTVAMVFICNSYLLFAKLVYQMERVAESADSEKSSNLVVYLLCLFTALGTGICLGCTWAFDNYLWTNVTNIFVVISGGGALIFCVRYAVFLRKRAETTKILTGVASAKNEKAYIKAKIVSVMAAVIYTAFVGMAAGDVYTLSITLASLEQIYGTDLSMCECVAHKKPLFAYLALTAVIANLVYFVKGRHLCKCKRAEEKKKPRVHRTRRQKAQEEEAAAKKVQAKGKAKHHSDGKVHPKAKAPDQGGVIVSKGPAAASPEQGAIGEIDP